MRLSIKKVNEELDEEAKIKLIDDVSTIETLKQLDLLHPLKRELKSSIEALEYEPINVERKDYRGTELRHRSECWLRR